MRPSSHLKSTIVRQGGEGGRRPFQLIKEARIELAVASGALGMALVGAKNEQRIGLGNVK